MDKMDSGEMSLWEFKGIADDTDKMFLMATPFPVVFILITYLWFVLKFGPEFMKNRKPFKLDNILPIYNLTQVLGSCYLLAIGFRFVPFREAMHIGWNTPKCYGVIFYERLVHGAHLYFLAKVVELLDTVFFVLRKKQSQVSFLHVYHHTIMVICTWCCVKYSVHDSAAFVGMINSMVHVVMYSYYGLSIFPALTKYLWWKKYITMFQLIQFCLIFLNIVIAHFKSSCPKSYVLVSAVSFNTLLFLYLFGDFYIKSYSKKGKTNLEDNTVAPTEVSSNEDTKNGLNYLINHHKLAAKVN